VLGYFFVLVDVGVVAVVDVEVDDVPLACFLIAASVLRTRARCSAGARLIARAAARSPTPTLWALYAYSASDLK
jgi:uncharacterized membrane protein